MGYGGEGSRDVSRTCTSAKEITKGYSWSIKESQKLLKELGEGEVGEKLTVDVT